MALSFLQRYVAKDLFSLQRVAETLLYFAVYFFVLYLNLRVQRIEGDFFLPVRRAEERH